MKNTILILGLLILFTLAVFAATLTIDIPANDVPRVSEAFGSILGLGRNATVTEVQEATRAWIINQTKDYERRKNQSTFTPPPMEMQPTPTPGTTTAAAPAAVVASISTPIPTATPKKKKEEKPSW